MTPQRKHLFFTKDEGQVKGLVFLDEDFGAPLEVLTDLPQDIDPHSHEDTAPLAKSFAEERGISDIEADHDLPGVYRFYS